MIALLKGKVELKEGTTLIVDVNGVGYKITVAADVLANTSPSSQIKIYTYTYVRDDILELFGFSSIEDLRLFEKIIAVSGIGPRSAINIFSVGSREKIIEAVVKGEVDFFTQVPRFGRKNAQKLIIELRGKLGSLDELDLSLEKDRQIMEVLDILKSFGFSAKEAKEAVKNIDRNSIKAGQELTIEEKVRLALKYLGK